MKYQVLFSLKNNEKVFINVICCNHDWRFEGLRDIGDTPIDLSKPHLECLIVYNQSSR